MIMISAPVCVCVRVCVCAMIGRVPVCLWQHPVCVAVSTATSLPLGVECTILTTRNLNYRLVHCSVNND